MLYLIEAIGFYLLARYVAKYLGKTPTLIPFTYILIFAVSIDPILYAAGFIWTANTFLESLFINIWPYIGALIGIKRS